jgi:hypothetical protein
MDLFAFRPLSGKQKKYTPLRSLRLCGELLPFCDFTRLDC